MAGIEQLEIHSKSYIVRWVKVDDGHTISWSVQPHKKSINFGIVKHPGTGSTNYTLDQTELNNSEQALEGASDTKTGLFGKKDTGTAQEQLNKKGFIPIKWHGKCEADKVSMGTYDVPPGKGGMFGLIFDNTFSKQTSKNATFVLLTYPTGAPPQTTHHLPNLQGGSNANASRTSLGKHSSPRLGAAASESVDSFHSHNINNARPGTSAAASMKSSKTANYHVGVLHKRRRKKGQGYARRFFSLDYVTCTLSYYHNRNSSALRGAIPLSLAAIAADERRREISIDSGAEVWHLRASNAKEFSDWAHALERASRVARGLEEVRELSHDRLQVRRSVQSPPNNPQEEDREWQQVETLVSRIVGTRDALRRLVKDIAAEKHAHPATASTLSPALASPAIVEESDSYFQPTTERRPFWRRKSSATPLAAPTTTPPTSSTLTVPSPGAASAPTPTATRHAKKPSRNSFQEERTVQDHCNAVLADLDSVIHEFSNLLSNSKRRRIPMPSSAVSRKSYDSTSTEEFFDAAEGDADRSQLFRIEHQSEEDTPGSDVDNDLNNDASSVSSVEDEEDMTGKGDENSLYPSKPKSLIPLPITEQIARRTTIPPSTVLPPSLIAFVRKNVGKDLSTISMPVSANEPTSLLQRTAEQLEYANLLNEAAKQKTPKERLLYVAAFAVSQFSGGRAKERAIRKPFNPLLGETYELLRSETEVQGGMRLLVEKVSHRPVRLAIQADSALWSFAQAPAPTQKFWGKSAELTTEGRIRLSLRLPDGAGEEHYSWTIATMFLRNVVMGEKYVEPVGSMSVTNDTTGAKAVIEFRSKGMFGGRGEDVHVDALNPDGSPSGATLTGTWTQGLKMHAGPGHQSQHHDPEVWRAGRLVDNAASVYGMTAFAASLNEITALEQGRLPPTDTRLRPDQRLAEEGRLDEAEQWKTRLEEAQRARRRALEEGGAEHRPRWFVRVAQGADGDEVWRLKTGREGYWEERSKASGAWSGVEDIFDA